MQAMIFAAGLGTRLYPITKDKPKALAEVNEVSLLEHNIHFIANQGFDELTINVHHFSDKVIQFLKSKNDFGYKINISYEPALLDTAGGLAKASPFFREEEVLLYNVDIVSSINLKSMMDFHRKSKALATLAIRNRDTQRYLLFDVENRLQGWRNIKTKEEIICAKNSNSTSSLLEVDSELFEYAFSGIHIVSPKILRLLGEIRKHSLTPFYLEIAKKYCISGYTHNEDAWFDCGKPETLQQAADYLKS